MEDGRCAAYRVDKDSPAGQAGLKDGDVVESVNGAPISGMTSWITQESKFNAQTPVSMVVQRGKRKERLALRFVFSPWKAPDVNEALWKKIGLKVRPMTDEEVKLFELKSPYAYIITDVDAPRFEGLEHRPQVNDVLGKIAFVRPRNFDHFARILDDLDAEDEIPMVILRVVDQQTKQSVLVSVGQNDAQVSESASLQGGDESAQNAAQRKIIKTRIDIEEFEVK